MARRIGLAVIGAGAVSYFAGFVTEHLADHDTASATTQRLLELSWDAFLLLPLIAVGVATHRWPRWWLVFVITAVMFVWPLAVHEVEIASGLTEPLDEGCDPCVDTTFVSVLALPAFVVAAVSCGVARLRGR